MKNIDIGKHLIINFSGCAEGTMNDVEVIKKLLHDLAGALGVAVLHEGYHVFSPYGITGFAIVSASHISIHTWPEYAYMGIDIFSCREIQLEVVFDLLKDRLGSDLYTYQYLERTALERDAEPS